MLNDKVAVVYGAGGAIGGGVAHAFAREGPRSSSPDASGPVEAVAEDVASAEVAEVDALDEQAVDEHLESVIGQAGRVDIWFNASGSRIAELDAT